MDGIALGLAPGLGVAELAAVVRQFPVAFMVVYGVGFIAAVFIGLIALYNSKRPVGLEDAQRPSIIPKVKTDDDSQA